MNLAATIANMKAKGMTAEAIVLALECVVVGATVDEQAERRRAADRERKRLRNSAESAEGPSPLVPPLSPAPLTPPIIPPTLAGLGLVRDELEARLREAAGWQNEPAPMLAVTGEIDALLGQGASLELDVLPIIKALGSQPKRRSSWKYFIGPIRDAWQARISTEATGPPVAQVVPFSQPHSGASRAKIQPKSSRSDYFATVRSRLDEAERGPSSQSDGCDGIVIEGQAG